MRGIDELDHYELLEISRTATAREIDRAYRMAQQTYADGSLALYSVFESLDARAIRDRLDEAYRVLADPELRAQYDEIVKAETPTTIDLDSDTPIEQALRRHAEQPDRTGGAGDRAHDSVPPDSFDDVVEEFDAIEDDGSGEFDGVRLRRNRMFRGYEIDDISSVTKVNSTHLRNIEDENFGELPADVYVRGFVKAYAQTIGLDPKVVVPSYMARLEGSRGGTQPGGLFGRR
jgi:curved DNA-binding protein CbpA